MLQPHEIIARLNPELTADFFTHLHGKERKLYQATIDTLAKQRRFRPVFIERKQPPERHAWMKDALGRPANTAVAAHLLQIWFVGGHKDVLCDFLDALGIPHDENGTLEQLPPAPSREDLTKAVDTLIAKHSPGLVAAYLNTFQALDDTGGWSTLEELLKEDERLKF
ncbi:MAG TPA: hypothetical protein VFG14_12330 [Chthoniobacteraceae bacterium]|jgi:hypothetical protein|nr:hypothetical protein [Chthoniobacteraceae bacterium]